MNDFIIVSDSCCDLEKEVREKYDILYVMNTFMLNDKVFSADLDWKDLSVKDFYNIMRDGGKFTTSQVSFNEYEKVFEEALKNNKDVLYIACSSSLSKTIEVSYKVRDKLLLKYPDSKIICIDSLIACMGLGMLCIRASELRKEGKSIDEVSKWIEDNKLCVHQEGAVDNLVYLKRAGRVSTFSSFFGGLLSVKPIIISDIKGRNAVVEKVKGRKNSIERIVERTLEKIVDVDYQKIWLVHADCLDEALSIKDMLIEKLPNKDIEINISYIGPIIGSTVGPGMVAIYFYGNEETIDIENQ